MRRLLLLRRGRRVRRATRLLATTVDEAEVRKFAGVDWSAGAMAAPLHAMNPVRTRYIRDRVDLAEKRVADVGCGGGLLSASLAALGASVVGVDASSAAIDAAKKRSDDVEFVVGGPESLASRAPFHVVCAMEVIEHAADADRFLDALADLLDDDGHLFLSTLDRNVLSYLLGIVAAERVFRILPPGTHDWRKFHRPADLAVALGHRGFVLTDLHAINYLPLLGHRSWLSPFVPGRHPNFILHAQRRRTPAE